jgi:lipopolysaccharide/colanic/teichoic acid biosynthesis glycosyltransferase
MRHLLHLLLALCALLVLWPVLLVIALLIRREDGGPVFYRGERVGLHGRRFRIFKFRSMVLNADKLGPSSTAGNDPRITRTGAFLRKY